MKVRVLNEREETDYGIWEMKELIKALSDPSNYYDNETAGYLACDLGTNDLKITTVEDETGLTAEEKLNALRTAFSDVIWMAIRYANGRCTYAPSMVRDAVKTMKTVFPDWEVSNDQTINKPTEDQIGGISFAGDYLWDIMDNNEYDEKGEVKIPNT